MVERLDRGGALQLRFTYQGRRHAPFLKAPHPQTVVSTDRRGRPCIDPKAEAAVQALVAGVRTAIMNGGDPWVHIDPPLAAVVDSAASLAPLRLTALVDEAAPDLARGQGEQVEDGTPHAAARRGVYGVNSPEAREFRALALRAARAMARVLGARGVAPTCDQLQDADWVAGGPAHPRRV